MPNTSCNCCGGLLVALGILGNHIGVRCRNCGWTTTVSAEHMDNAERGDLLEAFGLYDALAGENGNV